MLWELEGLTESDSEEHYEGRSRYLLFTTESGIFPFVKYEEQLAELNDYCVYLLTCLENKLQEFEPAHFQQDDWDAPISWAQRKHLSWRFLYEDINKCTMLLLLLAFFESTLSEIAHWFSEITRQTARLKKIRNPKVSDYLTEIGACCGTHVNQALTKELAYYDEIRKIRNDFVHHEWDQLTDRYEKFRLADVIHMISQVLSQIEHSALSSQLLE